MTDTKIRSYTELNVEQKHRMNEIKNANANILQIIDAEIARATNEMDDDPTGNSVVAMRWLLEARQDFQTACMKAVRGVTRPGDDC